MNTYDRSEGLISMHFRNSNTFLSYMLMEQNLLCSVSKKKLDYFLITILFIL